MRPSWLPIRGRSRTVPSHPKLLGVLLCYNDGDIIGDSVSYLLEQGHDVIVWDHGSDDGSHQVLDGLRHELVELRTIPRDVDFYEIYPEMSRHLLANYVERYEWISWPDADEFLEGPDRTRPYGDWLAEAVASPHDWIQFRNFNFWWTEADDPTLVSTIERVRHYALFADCAPRLRSWRSSATNIRMFNHNPPEGSQLPELFNLRHYPMRSAQQMDRRLRHDRANIRRGGSSYHYDNMNAWPDRLEIPPTALHFDDGDELNPDAVFDWRSIYGDARTLTPPDD
jgi:hypothetical protein